MSIVIENLKKFLWCLVYAPEVALERYEELYEDIYKDSDLKEKNLEKIQSDILDRYPNLEFGREKPCSDTKGVDMGTKNPIIRDTLIERCYAAVFEEDHCIERAIKLLKTPDDDFDETTRRLVGGLKEIGFSYDEGNYLRRTCNLRPVALLLERLWGSFEAQREKEINEKVSPVVVPQEETISMFKKEEPKPQVVVAAVPNATVPNPTVSFPTLLENMEPMRFIFSNGNFSRFEKIDNVDQEIIALENEISALRKIQEAGAKLNNSGITSEYVIRNKETLKKFIEAAQSLTGVSQ